MGYQMAQFLVLHLTHLYHAKDTLKHHFSSYIKDYLEVYYYSEGLQAEISFLNDAHRKLNINLDEAVQKIFGSLKLSSSVETLVSQKVNLLELKVGSMDLKIDQILLS